VKRESVAAPGRQRRAMHLGPSLAA
jgi:hypothetical protein